MEIPKDPKTQGPKEAFTREDLEDMMRRCGAFAGAGAFRNAFNGGFPGYRPGAQPHAGGISDEERARMATRRVENLCRDAAEGGWKARLETHQLRGYRVSWWKPGARVLCGEWRLTAAAALASACDAVERELLTEGRGEAQRA